MKRLLAILICFGMLCTSACSSKETTITKSSGEGTETSSGVVEVDEGLFTVTVTIPADLMGETTQADLDKQVSEKGFKSATLNSDGSATFVMTKAKHKEIMKEFADEFDKSFQEIIDDEESSIVSITHNDDFTEFKIGYDGDEVGLGDAFTVLVFYAAGNMYGAYNGKTPDNVHVVFVNSKTGEIIEEGNSKDLGSSSDSNDNTNDDNGQYKAVELVDSGYTVISDQECIYWVATIKNPDEKAIYEFPKIIVTAYDKEGAVIATDDMVLSLIEPGEIQAYGSSLGTKGLAVDKVEFTVKSGSRITSAGKHIKSSDFSAIGVNVRKDSSDYQSFTGKIKNNSSNDCESAIITIILKKDGKMIFVLTDYLYSISAGEELAFDIQGYDLPAFDSYEINVIDWS